MNQISSLIAVFAYLSLLTVGGGMAAYPEMENLTVNVHHWLTQDQLVHFYSLGQMAPGPNLNMVAAIGERVAGFTGALVVVLAFYAPTGLFALIVGRVWIRLANWPWRTSIQNGLAPTALGLMLAGLLTFGQTALRLGHARITFGVGLNWIAVAMAVFVLVMMLRTKINPALLVLGCGLIGVIAFRGL
jgi:chromate transporter